MEGWKGCHRIRQNYLVTQLHIQQRAQVLALQGSKCADIIYLVLQCTVLDQSWILLDTNLLLSLNVFMPQTFPSAVQHKLAL